MLFKLQIHSYRIQPMVISTLRTVPPPQFTKSYLVIAGAMVKFGYLHKEEK